MKHFLVLVFVLSTLVSKAQSFEELMSEFNDFENKMLGCPKKDTLVTDKTLFLSDYQPVWMTDLPKGNGPFGLVKLNDEDLKLSNIFSLSTISTYGSNYILVDVFDPPQGSIHDVKYYFKRNFVHHVDSLKKDTIYWSDVELTSVKLIGDTNQVKKAPKYIDEVEYSIFNQITKHDNAFMNLPLPIKKLDSSIVFKLMYMVEEVSVSCPVMGYGGSKTVYKGGDMNIRGNDLVLNNLEHSGMGFGMIGGVIYKTENHYVYEIKTEYIGNTSYFLCLSACFPKVIPFI